MQKNGRNKKKKASSRKNVLSGGDQFDDDVTKNKQLSDC